MSETVKMKRPWTQILILKIKKGVSMPYLHYATFITQGGLIMIKKLSLGAVIAALLVALPAQAQLAQSLDQMEAQHVLLGVTPEGAVKNFIDACFVYMNPATRNAGREMLRYLAPPLQSESSWDRLPGNRLFSERLSDPRYAHVWRSYAKGATLENGYRMDPGDWELNFDRGYLEDSGRGIGLKLQSGGADMPRVVYVKKNEKTGLYYVTDWKELLSDVRK